MAWQLNTPPIAHTSSNGDLSIERTSLFERIRQIPLSFYGLLAGILGLGFATIPSIALERPLPNPFGTEVNRKIANPAHGTAATPSSEKHGSSAWKRLAITLGKKVKKEAEPTNPAEQQKPAEPHDFGIVTDPLRGFSVAAVVCGLVGLSLSAIAITRERRNAVTVTAMGCSIAAMIWQYVLFGIVAGVIVVVVLVLLKVLAEVWG